MKTPDAKVIPLGNLHRGRCLLRVDGLADVNGEPRSGPWEIEFNIRSVRVRRRVVKEAGNEIEGAGDPPEDGVMMDRGKR